MTLRVVLTGPAERDLRRLDRQVATRVTVAIEQYAWTGSCDVKKLSAADEEWRLRVGDWRVRFTLDGVAQQLIVLRVLPRGRAYRG